MVLECDPSTAQTVQIGRVKEGLAPLRAHDMGDEIRAPLIDDNEQNILA